MKKAVIYTRTSANLTDFNLTSINAQVIACKDFAEKNGINIIGLYTDITLVGTKRNRSGWKNIMNFKKPKFDAILIYDMSRIGRDYKKVCKDRLKLKNRGVHIISVTNEIPDDLEEIWFSLLQNCPEEYTHDRK